MKKQLRQHFPEFHELTFYQRLLSDPATMSYNRNYDVSYFGYHRDTGCIDFPESHWQEWYDRWCGSKTRFFAYIVREEDGAFVGYQNIHPSSREGWYEMGIIIEACHRGKGYSAEGLEMLLKTAFVGFGAKGVTNTFEITRRAAVKIHLAAGFEIVKQEGDLLYVDLPRERYFAMRTEIVRLQPDTPMWDEATDFAENCSWIAGKHIAHLLRDRVFTDWETAFAAVYDGGIVGGCTFMKEDYYPENRYSPWISSIFVAEAARGARISHRLIESAVGYAKEQGFDRVYIPSDMTGFYEKCGFAPIDTLINYGGDVDTIYMREIG